MIGLPTIPISELVLNVQSGFASGKKDENGIAQIRMNNVTIEGRLDFSSIRYVPHDAVKRIDKYKLADGDVIFNATNSPNLVGKTALFIEQGEPFVFSNHFIRIKTDPNKLNSSYFARWLTLQQQKGLFELLCNRWVNQASVRKDDLLAQKIPLPPLPEQQRIAAILDKADALRAKRRAALAKLDTLLQATFLDMFGDPVTNPMGWETLSMEDVIIDGPQNGLYRPSTDYGSGTPIIRIDSFYAGKVIGLERLKRLQINSEIQEKYRVRQNEILIN